ncbi:MAG TPA: hypothetical protein VNR61_12370 [Niallia sp.]|nr:hypothetical protein [Niallia sp.]
MKGTAILIQDDSSVKIIEDIDLTNWHLTRAEEALKNKDSTYNIMEQMYVLDKEVDWEYGY